MFDLIINILFIISGIGLGVIPLIWDIKKEAPTRARPDKKIYTRMGMVFIGTIMLAVTSGAIKYVMDNNASLQNQSNINSLVLAHITDSLQRINIRTSDSLEALKIDKNVDSAKSLLKEKSFQYDNLSLKLQLAQKENSDLQKEINSPNIEEVIAQDDSLCPHLQKLPGKFAYWIHYANTGGGLAKNIRVSCPVLSYNDNVGFKLIKHGAAKYMDKNKTLESQEDNSYGMFMYSNELSPMYICLEIKYENSFGKEMPPYRRIYLYDTSFVDKNVPKVKNDDKGIIESFLFTEGLWNHH